MTVKVILSKRMQAVADMVTKGSRACDVGCDHGYVPIYLVRQGISPAVLAMDINKGPLLKAREHVTGAGLGEYITLRLSDGLERYRPGEAETLICAGMGGRLIQKILERSPHKTADFKELILQPQSEVHLFRKSLKKMGYSIDREDMILEDGKFYPVIKAVPGRQGEGIQEQGFGDVGDCFGPKLLETKHPVLILYLQREWESCTRLKESLARADGIRVQQRIKELGEKMDELQRAAQICGCKLF